MSAVCGQRDSFRSAVEYRGRRHFAVNSEFSRWNFLVHHTDASTVSQYVAPQGLDQTKFTKGFYRRAAETIWPKKDKDACNLARYEAKTKKYEARREFLKDKSTKSVNPILEPRLPASSGKKVFGAGPTAEQERETLTRNRSSVYRFWISDRKKALHANRNVKQCSSVLGIGRSDIPSRGVLDNFMGHGYAQTAPAKRAVLKVA